MVQSTSFIVALLISTLFTIYMVYDNKKSNENKKDNIQIFIVFVMSFLIAYMISNLIIDSNDDKQIMNNIKIGEPPF